MVCFATMYFLRLALMPVLHLKTSVSFALVFVVFIAD